MADGKGEARDDASQPDETSVDERPVSAAEPAAEESPAVEVSDHPATRAETALERLQNIGTGGCAQASWPDRFNSLAYALLWHEHL